MVAPLCLPQLTQGHLFTFFYNKIMEKNAIKPTQSFDNYCMSLTVYCTLSIVFIATMVNKCPCECWAIVVQNQNNAKPR